MNSVVLIGNLTRDPELRYSTGASQTAICRFTVAVNDRRRNPQTQEWEDNASFIPIVVFGKTAENCEKYLAKGRKVAVNGRIQTGSYTNREGARVYTTDIVVEEQDFAESKANAANYNGGYSAGNGYQNAPAAEPQAPARPDPAYASGGQAASDGFMTIPEGIEEELPFI